MVLLMIATCIICSGKTHCMVATTHDDVSEMLCDDLCSLSSWTRDSQNF